MFLQTVNKDIQIALLLISLLYTKTKQNKILLVGYFISLLKICPHFNVQTIGTGSCFCTYHVPCRNLNLLILLGVLTLLFFSLIYLKPLTFKGRKHKQSKIIRKLTLLRRRPISYRNQSIYQTISVPW